MEKEFKPIVIEAISDGYIYNDFVGMDIKKRRCI